MVKGIGERIKELRLERDLSMDMLVADMNRKYLIEIDKPFNKSMISRWESDINNPTLQCAKCLCDYFNVSLDYLIGLTDVRTPSRLLSIKKCKETT